MSTPEKSLMNFMLGTASNRGVNLGPVSKNVFEKNKITASFDSTYSANIIFASEDKQVHSSNINNESSFVKFTLNVFLCELFISVFFVLTN